MTREKEQMLITFGTCGLNSTALCIASTAVTSAVVSPLLLAISGENLRERKNKITSLCGMKTCFISCNAEGMTNFKINLSHSRLGLITEFWNNVY
jgi:hypothetical protein